MCCVVCISWTFCQNLPLVWNDFCSWMETYEEHQCHTHNIPEYGFWERTCDRFAFAANRYISMSEIWIWKPHPNGKLHSDLHTTFTNRLLRAHSEWQACLPNLYSDIFKQIGCGKINASLSVCFLYHFEQLFRTYFAQNQRTTNISWRMHLSEKINGNRLTLKMGG